MGKTFSAVLILGVLLAPGFALGGQSGSITSTASRKKPSYSDRVRAVPRRPLLKSGRVEWTPRIGVSINDSYYTHSVVGATMSFFPSEFWGIGVGGSYFLSSTDTQNVELVRQGMLASPAKYELPSSFGYLEFQWIPVYGKLSLFSRGIFHFETYLSLGGGVHAPSLEQLEPAAVASVGQRITLSQWCTFSIELRDMLYSSNYEVYQEERSTILNYLVLSTGLSFFIPPSFEYAKR